MAAGKKLDNKTWIFSLVRTTMARVPIWDGIGTGTDPYPDYPIWDQDSGKG